MLLGILWRFLWRFLLCMIPGRSMIVTVFLGALRRIMGIFALLMTFYFKALSLLDAFYSRMITWPLFDIASCTIFPRRGVLHRHSSRRINLSSIFCEFCCQMMFYTVFNNLLVPGIPMLDPNNWKSSKASSCEFGDNIGGLIGGTRTNLEIYWAWSRSLCSGVYSNWFATPCGGVEEVDWSLLE